MFVHIIITVQSEFPVLNLKMLFAIINMCTCCPQNWFKQSSSLSLCLPSLSGWVTVWKLYSMISLSVWCVHGNVYFLKSLSLSHTYLLGFFSKTYSIQKVILKNAPFMHVNVRNWFMSWIIFLWQVLWQYIKGKKERISTVWPSTYSLQHHILHFE